MLSEYSIVYNDTMSALPVISQKKMAIFSDKEWGTLCLSFHVKIQNLFRNSYVVQIS